MKNRDRRIFSNDPDGSVDLDSCPRAYLRATCSTPCLCGGCAICGHRKHVSLHGPLFGQPAGSKPYGHRFVAKQEKG